MTGDDLHARFDAVVAQIGEDERRRMRAAATKGMRSPRRTRPRRRVWLAAWIVVAVVAGAAVLVAAWPELLADIVPAVRQEPPAVLVPGPGHAEGS
ncbi:hypothetical protein [Nonomuraea sp. NPDC003754]